MLICCHSPAGAASADGGTGDEHATVRRGQHRIVDAGGRDAGRIAEEEGEERGEHDERHRQQPHGEPHPK